MLDAVATVILAGMMFIPIINLVVGIIVGTGLFGVAGGFAGAALAVLIMALFNRRVDEPTVSKRLVTQLEGIILQWRPKRRSALAFLSPPAKRK
jgi:predicted PurR-regulated permease PerM